MSDKIVVLDIGEYETRIGFSGEKEPVEVFPTIVDGQIPIHNGVVTNWDQVEKIITKSFDILKVKPEDVPVLITESLNISKSNRERWTQILFDTFEIPSLYIASQPYLSLAAVGRTTGMALCVSEGSSYAVPIYENVPSKWALKSCEVTGSKITESLIRYLNTETGNNFGKEKYKHEISDLKEKYFYVAKNYEDEVESISSKFADWKNENITLFDSHVNINEQRFILPEILFKPDLNGINGDSIEKVLFDSIMKYPEDERNELYKNIVLSGGTTLMNGFYERLCEELKKLTPDDWNVQINSPNDKNLVWKGGSIVANLPDFEKMMITKDEYDDYYSPTIAHIKCFT